jgi:hypothetical protein
MTAEYTKALSKLVTSHPSSHPSVVQVRDAVKGFTDVHSDADAVLFLKKTALEPATGDDCWEPLAAFIGLALLSESHETVAFLKSHVDDNGFRGHFAFIAISFLPIQDARAIAEGVVSDAEQGWRTRIAYLFLLRAVGNGDTLGKLEQMGRTKGCESAVRDRTIAFLKARLALKDPHEQERWARQELLLLQVGSWVPNFRFSEPALKWSVKHIHSIERDISIELLKTKLSLAPRSAYTHDLSWEGIPFVARIIGMQKNTELLPLLDEWSNTDSGIISTTCREVARQLREQGRR